MVPLDTPLEIAACRLYEVAVPLMEPYRMSGGTLRTRRSLIVEVTDQSGAVGYGESAPFEQPFYSEETLDSAKACIIQHLVPRIDRAGVPGARGGGARAGARRAREPDGARRRRDGALGPGVREGRRLAARR